MIDFTKVLDVDPSKNTFIMEQGFGNPHKVKHISVIELSPSAFNKQLFLLKKWLKEQRHPNDRVMPFECQNEHGCFSFDKFRRIYNSRLKPDENQELIGEGDFIL